MRRFPAFFMTFLLLLASRTSSALSVDQKLLALVPSGAQIVAGVDSSPPKGQSGSFVFITYNNIIDLQDYFALTGADSSLMVRHTIFVATDDGTKQLGKHSLIMRGHFDRTRVYKSAADGAAKIIEYHGLSVLEVQPFAREQGEFHEVRWLAILDSDVLLFGTVASVQQEMDRYLSGSAADPLLARRLASMRPDDQTWCVLSVSPARNPEIWGALRAFDAKMAELAEHADAFQFGIRYGRQVELEYQATTAAIRTISNSLFPSVTGSKPGTSLLPGADIDGDPRTERGVIKFSMGRYNAWLTEVSTHNNGPSMTSPWR